MIKRLLLLMSLLSFLAIGRASGEPDSIDYLSQYKNLTIEQLTDTADKSYYANLYDKALACYGLIINLSQKNLTDWQQEKIVEAYNKSAIIYNQLGDYRQSFGLLIKGLELCEEYHYDSYTSRFYTNMGDIYYHLGKLDMAKRYDLKALETCKNDISMITILNNLGVIETESGHPDKVMGYLNHSLSISRKHGNLHSHVILHSIATYYQKIQQYDSAFHYLALSLKEAEKIYNNKAIESVKAQNLSTLGKLYFETHKTDSALHYLKASNEIASKNNFGEIWIKNYSVLSEIEEARGNNRKALNFYQKYVYLKDSISNIDRVGEIDQLKYLHEIEKTNAQLEKISIEQKINRQTIHYQKLILIITGCVLLFICIMLTIVFWQKRELNKAYKILFEKNKRIVEFQENSPERNREKYQRSTLSSETQKELFDKIFSLMENPNIFCDADFSLNKLAELVQSNPAYVSQVINTTLKKNFRTFLNEYRIREALRLFSEPDAKKYTIEFTSSRVGFKSTSTFRVVFKEITGVSPTFYLKSMQEQTIQVG